MSDNPLICPICRGPRLLIAMTLSGICPKCYEPPFGAMPHEFSERDVQELVATLVYIKRSQKAAAEYLGVSPQYVNDIMHGRRSVGDTPARNLGLVSKRVFIQSKDGTP